MNACPQEDRWIRLMAGELEPAEQTGLLDHLERCSACRRHYEELLAVRRVLAALAWDPPERDLVAGVRAAALRDRRRQGWLRVVQAAAVVALAAGAGLLAGRAYRPASALQTALAEVSTEQVVQAVGLDVFDQGALLNQLFGEDSFEPDTDEETPS
jgi:anti-sigma factor RsiW